MENAHRLIVRERHLNEESLKSLLGDLHVRFGIDSYSARMNLKGDSLSILAFDQNETRLMEIGQAIENYDYEWFISDLHYPKINPFIAKSFRLTKESIIFKDAKARETELLSGARVMVVIASFSDSLTNKIVQKATNARNKDIHISTQEKFTAIMQSGKVVMDFYILPRKFHEGIADHGNISPIRLTSGGFDPASLGKYATQSAIKNLETALRIIRKYTGSFSLEMDFGLCSLPGIQQEQGGIGSVENNLKALSHYGWLLQSLYRQNEYRSEKKSSVSASAGGVIAGIATAAHEVANGKSIDDTAANAEVRHSEIPATMRILQAPPPERGRNSFIGPWSVTSIALAAVLLLGAISFGSLIRFSTEIVTFWWFTIGRNGTTFFIMGLLLFYLTFRYLKLKRWIENTPTSKARSLSMGMVEMKGTAERMFNLVAPISQTACVYYRLKKYVKTKGRRGENQWSLASDTNSGPVPFILRDETGSVIVEPEGANMGSLRSETFGGGISPGLGTLGVPSDVKYIEETIPELASIYVLGFASPRRADTPSVDKIKTEKLRQIKQNPEKLNKYDENQNGLIDEDEWEKARQDAEYSALKESLAEKEEADKIEEKAVIHKPLYRGLPFIVAEESEGKLLFWFNFRGVVYFSGAIASSVAGVILLVKFLAFG